MEDDLEQFLQKIDLSGYRHGNRKKGTELLTREIHSFSKIKEMGCKREVFIGLRRPSNDYRGIVDFVLSSDSRKYAIEIDSSNKRWSLKKLMYAAENGYQAIWVRWCSKVNLEIPNNIRLIDLTLKPKGKHNAS